jgi:glycosyltransferase involved in cell wall biosynthesis
MPQYKVLHIMLNDGKSGMEESFRHYNLALKNFCHVTALIHPNCYRRKVLAKDVDLIIANNKLGLLSSILHSKKLVKQIEPDLVIAHGSRAVFAAKCATLGSKTRIIGVRYTLFKSKFAALKWSLQTDYNIAVNNKLVQVLGPKTFLIYKVINQPLLEGGLCSINPHRPIKIGFLGRLIWQKGIQFLIRAIGSLNAKSLHNYELVIGGEGPYMTALKNLVFLHGVDDKVKFLNYVENKKAFFQDIDIFCLPAIEETFSLILVESMAYGIPIIASDIPGIQEVVENTRNGLLFKSCDHHDLANKITALATNNEIRLSMIEEGFKDVKNKFTLDRLTRDLLEVFNNLMTD